MHSSTQYFTVPFSGPDATCGWRLLLACRVPRCWVLHTRPDHPCAALQVTPDEQYVFATGYHPPQVKVYDLAQLSLKFDRHMDAEIVDFQVCRLGSTIQAHHMGRDQAAQQQGQGL